ncbi:MAG: response regulator transcription factor [Chitinophagaceae bacterium]|nr:MAG: response regulator transcription factor [Chitinophagaceae bacterium]
MRVAILDDEPLAVELLCDYVRGEEGLELVSAGGDAFATLRLVQSGGVDLLLLDVQMPELTGLQFLRIAGDSCRVILTTAYPDYALEGYEYSVVDYLLKPIAPERFRKAIAKARGAAAPVAPQGPDHLFLKSEYRLVRIAFDDILYVEALRDYVAVHTAAGKTLHLESLRTLEGMLPSSRFMRIHKSYLIALDKIRYIERNGVTIAGQTLPIGNTYRDAFVKKVGNPG